MIFFLGVQESSIQYVSLRPDSQLRKGRLLYTHGSENQGCSKVSRHAMFINIKTELKNTTLTSLNLGLDRIRFSRDLGWTIWAPQKY